MRSPLAREAASSPPADLRRRLRFAFAALGVLILAIVVGAIVIAKDIHDSAQRTYLREVIPLRTTTRDVELQLLNEETGVRGLIITGRRTSLAPYASGSKAAAADVALLRASAAHDATLARLVPAVVTLHEQLEVFFANEVRLAATGPAGRARAAAQVETGKAIFDRFRSAVGEIQQLAEARTVQAKSHEDALFRRLAAVVGGFGLLAIALVALLAWLVPERAFVLLSREEHARVDAQILQRETEAMQTLTADLSASTTVDDVRAALVRTGLVLLDAEAVSIALDDPGRSRLDVWSYGFPSGRDPDWEADGSPGTAAIRDGQPRFVERGAGSPFPAFALLPLEAPGERPRGFVSFHYLTERRFPRAERARLRVVGVQVESALSRAEAHDRERRAAQALQRALLPASLPSPANTQLVGHYEASAGGTIVGGDWYDAVELENGVIAGSVGDVSGHGILAAAQMGRLRHSYRAYALEHRSPAEILARLTRHIGVDSIATVTCFDIDPGAKTLRYCVAGHPPAIVYQPDSGDVAMLDGHAPPIGIAAPDDFSDYTLRLAGRCILFAYTDGLVEARGESITDRIEMLVERVRELPSASLADGVAHLLDEMRTARSNPDDIAILAIAI